MLNLLVLLEAGRNVFAEILDFPFVVRPEVVPIHLTPLQLKVVSARLYMMCWHLLLLKSTDQHILEPL
jgi:hypothetical protein